MARPRKHPNLPKHVHRQISGKKEYFIYQYRRSTPLAGPRTRIPFQPDTPEFWAMYNRLKEDRQVNAPDTLNAVIATYQRSAKYENLKPNTQRDYDFYLKGIGRVFGKTPADSITPLDVQNMYDALVTETPVKAKKSIAVMRALYAFAMPRGMATHNPARADFDLIKHKPQGSEPWPIWAFETVNKFARWEVRTFVALALYTGQRTSDVVRMEPHHVAGNKIRVVQEKTGKDLWIPIHKNLAGTIVECRQRGAVPFIHSPNGQAMAPETFRALFKREMTRYHSSLVNPFARFQSEKITPHGLRKSAVVKLREAGVNKEDCSLLVGMSPPMVDRYSQGWHQEERAEIAMTKWENNAP